MGPPAILRGSVNYWITPSARNRPHGAPRVWSCAPGLAEGFGRSRIPPRAVVRLLCVRPNRSPCQVVVIGTTTVDLFLTGVERLPSAGADEFTPENVAFLEEPLTMVLGGNAANSAYVLAGLDSPTSLCSVIGRDILGALVLDWLTRRGVILDGLIQTESSATSSTTVAIDRSLHRLSLHHRGGSPEFSPEQVPPDLVSRARCLLLTSYQLLPKFRGRGVQGAPVVSVKLGTVGP
jgi:pfkB family carbohydrate kinase